MKERTDDSPNPAKFLQNEGNSLRSRQQELTRLAILPEDANRVELFCVGAMSAENLPGKGALQRGKTEYSLPVTSENEPYETVA